MQVIHRLGADAPKKSLVENYMIEIARNYKIDYDPDPTMFLVSWKAVAACAHLFEYGCQQEDDAISAATSEFGEPFVPDGSQAGPLPHKQEIPDTRYSQFPPSAGPAPPTHNHGVSMLVLTIAVFPTE